MILIYYSFKKASHNKDGEGSTLWVDHWIEDVIDQRAVIFHFCLVTQKYDSKRAQYLIKYLLNVIKIPNFQKYFI